MEVEALHVLAEWLITSQHAEAFKACRGFWPYGVFSSSGGHILFDRLERQLWWRTSSGRIRDAERHHSFDSPREKWFFEPGDRSPHTDYEGMLALRFHLQRVWGLRTMTDEYREWVRTERKQQRAQERRDARDAFEHQCGHRAPGVHGLADWFHAADRLRGRR